MTDIFSSTARSPGDPTVTLFAITPDDTADLEYVTLGINVATPGTVRVTMADGSMGDITVSPGAAFPIRVRRVWQSGTTATGIYGLT